MSALSLRLGRDRPEAWSELRALELRDWAVKVLDAFSRQNRRPVYAKPVVDMSGSWSVYVNPTVTFIAGTAEMARHEAAMYCFPRLDQESQDSIGYPDLKPGF